jgi:hypothetical protein
VSACIPKARATDPASVRVALDTAAEFWEQADSTSALVWLRQAVEGASDSDQDARALELAKARSLLVGTAAAFVADPPTTLSSRDTVREGAAAEPGLAALGSGSTADHARSLSMRPPPRSGPSLVTSQPTGSRRSALRPAAIPAPPKEPTALTGVRAALWALEWPPKTGRIMRLDPADALPAGAIEVMIVVTTGT